MSVNAGQLACGQLSTAARCIMGAMHALRSHASLVVIKS